MADRPYVVQILDGFDFHEDSESFDELEDAQAHAIMLTGPDMEACGIWHDDELIAIVYERETFWK